MKNIIADTYKYHLIRNRKEIISEIIYNIIIYIRNYIRNYVRNFKMILIISISKKQKNLYSDLKKERASGNEKKKKSV